MRPAPRRSTWFAALFALALHAYPRAFRRRFGAEMQRDFLRRPSVRQLVSIALSGVGERGAATARWTVWSDAVPHLYKPFGRRAMFWDTVRGDIRYAVRMARRAPLSTSLAVAALALGIGANTAIFTVVYGVLLRPLPYQDADRLVMVWSDDRNSGKPENPISPADFADLRDSDRSTLDLAGYFSFIVNSRLSVNGGQEIARSVSVMPGLFPLLGREAAVGRALTTTDRDRIVISDGFWHRRFGGDPRVVGMRVVVDGDPYTIAGVMPADFVFPYKGMLGPTGFTESLDVDVWVPLALNDGRLMNSGGNLTRSVHFLAAVGRLRPGATAEQARAALTGVAARLERAYPDTNRGWGATVRPLHAQVVGAIRPALLVLAAGVALILLMACVNVANLVLARAIARRKELAVRAALGAGPRRLASQALTESLLLAVSGAAAALLFAGWGVRALVTLAPGDLPRLHEVHPDWVVLAVSMAVSMAAGVAIGVAPALVAARGDVQRALQDSTRGSIGSLSKHRLRSMLVIAEIALALVLTIGAGLLLRSFDRLLSVDPGFRVDHVLTFQMNAPDRLKDADARRAFYGTLFERLAALPGVVSVGGTTRIPLGSTSTSTTIQVEGRAVPAGERPTVEFRRAMRDYFATMGIPIVRGRGFTAEDGPAAPGVAVINQTMARRVFGNEDPIGQHVRTGPNATGPWMTIVGVIGDVRHSRLDEAPEPELYISSLQNPPVSPFIAIRTSGDPAALADLVRAEARVIDPTLTLYDIRTMREIRSASVAEPRFVLLLIGLFGALAIVLASVGVYGVMSLAVSERTQEVGVRLALGAAPSSVLRLIVGDAVGLAAAGAGVGVLLAAALSPLMASQLFGVRPLDPVTFASVPALLVAVSAVAALVPGVRAMRIDPIRALNE